MNGTSPSSDGGKFDAIVVGAGLGGLAAGARLALAGRRVLVLEQHYRVGGFATTFARKGGLAEVSLHLMTGFDDPGLQRVLGELRINGALEFVDTRELMKCVHVGRDHTEVLTLPYGAGAAAEALISRHPDEAAGIRTYFSVILGLQTECHELEALASPLAPSSPEYARRFPLLARYGGHTLARFLDEIVGSFGLKVLLCANLIYFHDNASELSLVAFARGQASYFHRGSYIRGGSQKLSDHLASLITAHGGEILLRHRVTEILVESGAAVGVRACPVRASDGASAGERVWRAEVVFANCALPRVFDELIPSLREHKYSRQLTGRELSLSMSLIHLFFDRSGAGPGAGFANDAYHTVFLESDAAAGARGPLNGYRFKSLYGFTDYSRVDTGLCAEGRAAGTILIADRHERWSGLGREEYLAAKRELAERYLARVGRQIPGLRDAILHQEVATPLTIERYTGHPRGAVYGFALDPGQSMLNAAGYQGIVQRLYFASAWAYGHGFEAALRSGFACAGLALDKDLPASGT